MTAWVYLSVGEIRHHGTRHTSEESILRKCKDLYAEKHPEETVYVWKDGSKYLFNGNDLVKWGSISEMANELSRCTE